MTSSTESIPDNIVNAYLAHLDKQKKAPTWVYQFVDQSEITKEEFYKSCDDLTDLENHIWNKQFKDTVKVLQRDPTYSEYSTREKMLAFYYTLIEVLNDNRFALTVILNRSSIPMVTGGFMQSFKYDFKRFTKALIEEGIGTGEIATRPFIMERYGDVLWQQCLFILRFWSKENTKDLSATDEAIERSTNLGFDLMGHTSIDSLLGFTGFLYKNWKIF